MTRYSPLFILSVLLSQNVFAQEDLSFLSYNVHFEKDQFQLASTEQAELDSFLNVMNSKSEINRIRLVGHTDSDADSIYNMELSKNRVTTVANYLIKYLGIIPDQLLTDYKGEDKPIAHNTDENNMAKNRRVELLIAYEQKTIIAKESIEDLDSLVVEEDCEGNSTISGSYEMLCESRPEYHCPCLQLTDFSANMESGTNTTTSSGEILSSCGMFCLSVNDSCDKAAVSNFLKTTGVIIRRPVDSCSYLKDFDLFTSQTSGEWNEDKSKSNLKVVKINGKSFYEFTIYSLGCFNCDKRECEAKVKAYYCKKMELIQMYTYTTCPFSKSDFSLEKEGICEGVIGKDQLSELRFYGEFLFKNDTLVVDESWTNVEKKTFPKTKFKTKKRNESCVKSRFLGFKIKYKTNRFAIINAENLFKSEN